MDGRAGAFNELHEPEVADLHLEVFVEQDVLGLDITVNDVALIEIVDRLGALANDADQFRDRNARPALRLMFLPVLQQALRCQVCRHHQRVGFGRPRLPDQLIRNHDPVFGQHPISVQTDQTFMLKFEDEFE